MSFFNRKKDQRAKNSLAQLMAQERINVVRSNSVSTGYFDVKTRTLKLPVFKTGQFIYPQDSILTDDLMETVFIGREIAHALWTPKDALTISKEFDKKGIDSKHFKSLKTIFNVVDDIRVEKKCKTKYPGMKQIFSAGWNFLWDKNWFHGSKIPRNTPIHEFNFLDRLNVNAKRGPNALVPFFNQEETDIVDEMDKVESFEDSVNMSIKILEYLLNQDQPPPQSEGEGEGEDGDDGDESNPKKNKKKNKNKNNKKPSSNKENKEKNSSDSKDGKEDNDDEKKEEEEKKDKGNDKDDSDKDDDEGDKDDSKDDGNGDEDSDEKGDDDSSGDNEGDEEGGPQPSDEDDDGDSSDSSGDEGENSPGKDINDFVPLNDLSGGTYDNLANGIESIKRTAGGSPVYFHLPTAIPKKLIVSYQDIYNKLSAYFSGIKKTEEIEYIKYFDSMKPVIGTMVNEFNMYKSASDYEKSKISKTGVLDVNKLHQFKFSEDIFKRVTIVPKGKNHGFVMLVDWSGSMGPNLHSTMKQILNLVWFCQKLNLAFDVYAIGGPNYAFENNKGNVISTSTNKEEIDFNNLRLLHLLSSNMKRSQLHDMMVYLYSGTANRRALAANGVDLIGYTPLMQALCVSHLLVKELKKRCEIVHLIVLSDGDDNNYVSNSVPGATFAYDSAIIFDPVTKNETTLLTQGAIWQFDFHAEVINLLRKITEDSNMLSFYLTNNHDYLKQRYANVIGHSQKVKLTSKNKKYLELREDSSFVIIPGGLGYNEYYLLNQERLMENTSTKGDKWFENLYDKYTLKNMNNAINDHMKIIADHRVFLSSFVRQITGKGKFNLIMKGK